MVHDLILGTAGHIDHGKTALVRALTGTDTDRLPEEKRRGITIELGFAALQLGDFQLGIVDVPGHERFVRNMLCGATGMELALLVVAANESIRPQSREHFEILQLLGVSQGVVAITKCDLVDDLQRQKVEEEIRSWVEGTFLEHAPRVFTSTLTGEGLATLRDELEQAARRVAQARPVAAAMTPFRLPVDRSFTLTGHGTVVTGSVLSGECRVGDTVEIQPGGLRARVRGLRNHDRPVERVGRGMRAALNLAGVDHQSLGRGQELATPSFPHASRCLAATIDVLPSAPRPLADRTRVKLHVGTAEVGAVVRLFSPTPIAPGKQGLAQLFLNTPVAVAWNQPLILRVETPVATCAGGRVLVPECPRVRRTDYPALEMVSRMVSPDPRLRVAAAVYLAGFSPWAPSDLTRMAGVENGDAVVEELLRNGDFVAVDSASRRRYVVHRGQLAVLQQRLVSTLAKFHARQPLQPSFPVSALAAGFQYVGDEALVAKALDALHLDRKVHFDGQKASLTGTGPRLTPADAQLLRDLVAAIGKGGMQPPTLKELQQQLPRRATAIPQLLAVAVQQGDLVEFGAGFYLGSEQDGRSRELLGAALARGAGLTVSQIREILQTSRKYAVPYCEYLDRTGFTVRRGDLRFSR